MKKEGRPVNTHSELHVIISWQIKTKMFTKYRHHYRQAIFGGGNKHTSIALAVRHIIIVILLDMPAGFSGCHQACVV